MDQPALERKLASIPVEAPDAIDLAMMDEAKRENDGSHMSLEAFNAELDGYSGKILVRIPRSLHKQLAIAAKQEGVSLNQYALYKLSR